MNERTTPLRWLSAATIACCLSSTLQAQVLIVPPLPAAPAAPAADKKEDAAVVSGVSLDTNGDVDTWLSKAAQYAESGNYRNTLLLLNHVEQNFANVLTQMGEGRYVPARVAVERMIRQMPAEGLALYRLDADGLLRGKLGGDPMACRDEQALREAVEHWFLADGGDQAAYMLACIRIDQGRWFDAQQLLMHIEADYPDPKVDAIALQQRLAYASIRSGDLLNAQRVMDRLTQKQAAAQWLTDAMAAALRSQKQIAAARTAPPAADDLLMDAGVAGGGQWIALWQQTTPARWSTESPENMRYGNPSQTNPAQMRKKWLANGWLPTSQAASDGERLYYKIGEMLRCVDKHTGLVLWTSQPSGDDDTRAYGGVNFGNVDWPGNPAERLFFAERIGRMIAVDGTRVYQIVGDHPTIGPSYRQPGQRGDGNALVAMDGASGEMKWRTTIDSQVAQPAAGQTGFPTTRFLTTPVRFDAPGRGAAAALLTAIDDEGEVRLVAINPDNGAVLWNRFLCSAPPGYAPPGAPVAISVRDGIAYVVSGHGTVFAIDGRGGEVVWATNYRRDEPKNADRQMRGMEVGWLRESNWLDNTVWATGEHVLAAAADARGVMVFDRRTGENIGKYADPQADDANENLNYVVGRRGDRLYLGGTQTMACFDVHDGRLYWRTYLDHAGGRATMDDRAIFAPSGDTVVRIDPISGKWVSQGRIVADNHQPIGNLFSDGSVLVSLGMEEACGLADAAKAMAWLGGRIDAGEAELLLVRARLYQQMDRPAQAMADLRSAHDRIADPQPRQQAGDQLLEMLLAQAAKDPQHGRELIDQAAALAGEEHQKTRVTLARADWLAGQGDMAGAIALNWPIIHAEPVLLALDSGDPDWQVDPAELARDRINRWIAAAPQLAAAPLAASAEQALTLARQQTDAQLRLNVLYPLAITAPSQPAASAAMRDILEQVQKPPSLQLARAELLLEHLANNAPPPGTTPGPGPGSNLPAEAQALLAQIYQKHQHPSLARDAWRQLQQRWPAQTIADPAAQIAAMGDVPEAADPLTLPQSQLQVIWRLEKPEAQPIALQNGDDFDDDAFLASHVILYDPSWRRLTCYDAQTAAGATWSVQLPLTANISVFPNNYQRQFLGVRQGHVLVLVYTDSFQAIDILSGSILWTVKRDNPANQQPNNMNVRFMRSNGFFQPGRIPRDLNQQIDIDNGVVLFLDTAKPQPVAIAIDLFTGRTLWQRTSADNTITGLAMVDHHAVLAFNQGTEMWIGEPTTGRTIRTLDATDINISGQSLWLRDGLLYQNTQGNLAFLNVSRPDARWKLGGEGRQRYVQRIDRVSETQAIVVWNAGQTDLIELPDGKVKWSSGEQNNVNNFFDAALTPDGKRLVMLSFSNNEMVMQFFNAADGSPLFTIPLGRSFNNNLRISARTLATAAPMLPHLQSSNHRTPDALRFFRAADGKPLDIHLQAPNLDDLFNEMIQPPIIRNHTLILSTRTATYAFGVKSGDDAAAAPPAEIIETPPTPPDTQTVTTPTGIVIRLRNGRIEMQTPGGGTIRAGNININQNGQKIQVRQVNGKLEVRINDKLVEPDKKNPAPGTAPETVPAPAP